GAERAGGAPGLTLGCTHPAAESRGDLIETRLPAGSIDFDRFARFYDWDTDTEADDLDFYRNMAARTGGPVLEVGCGTGRVLLPFAKAGTRLTGIDVSPWMLARARAELTAAVLAERVKLVEGDARTMSLDERFRLVYIALNTFMHFTAPAE